MKIASTYSAHLFKSEALSNTICYLIATESYDSFLNDKSISAILKRIENIASRKEHDPILSEMLKSFEEEVGDVLRYGRLKVVSSDGTALIII